MSATVTLNAAIDKRYVIEKLQPGEVLRLEECYYSAGGKGINVSRVERLSGEEVFAMGFIGGCSGGYIIEELKKLDIECDFTQAEGAVSYTHLDVYKRQPCIPLINCFIINNCWMKLELKYRQQ